MHNIQIMTEEISLPVRKLSKNTFYLILGHTKTKASYTFLMASCKSWISPANKKKVQQMTRMNWIRLYITQDLYYVIPLKNKDAPY
jgi:hypothetical protein